MASHGLAKLLALAVVDPDSGKPRMCNALELAKGAAAEFGPHVGLQNFWNAVCDCVRTRAARG